MLMASNEQQNLMSNHIEVIVPVSFILFFLSSHAFRLLICIFFVCLFVRRVARIPTPCIDSTPTIKQIPHQIR